MLAARASVFVECLVAATAMLALGLAPSPKTAAPPAVAVFEPPTCVIPDPPPRVLACEVLIGVGTPPAYRGIPGADQPYRAKDFLGAARALPDNCGDEIQLLGQLARAWDIGMDRRLPPTRRFEALAQARKLDLVFGGLYGDEIDEAIRGLVVRAAVKYANAGDRDSARLAIDTASLLGVHARELETASAFLDR
jgi:hypothetical protein